MKTIEENERKYLISKNQKEETWEREHIVYQWFLEKNAQGSVKEKIIFDLTRAKIIYARISKVSCGEGKNHKNVEYLDIRDFNPGKMVGIPFVLKRRSIREKVFLDRFLRSNGVTEYLLEYEGENFENATLQSFGTLEDVTGDRRYHNQNMCIPFSQTDAYQLRFLLNIF